MNGTSGFQEVQSSTSRSLSHQFLHEQRHQFGIGSRQLLYAHDLIALSTGISTKREKVPSTMFMPSGKPPCIGDANHAAAFDT